MDEKQSKLQQAYKWMIEHMTSKGLTTTWAKVIAGAVIGALAALIMNSCSNITPEQIYTVHDIYHKITNEPCIIQVDE